MTDTMTSLADRLASEMYTIENNRGRSLRRSYNEKADRLVLARATGADETAFGSISRKLFPPDYARPLKLADEAVVAQISHFEQHTLLFDHSAGGRARARRAILVALITAGTFLAENRQHCDAVKGAGEHFARVLQRIIEQIGNDPRYQATFCLEKYPTEDDVLASYSFQYAEETLEPLPSGASFPVTCHALQAAQRAYEERLVSKYRYGMQRAASELAASLANMADRVGDWAEYQSLTDGQRQEKFGTRAKAPGWKSTLTTNVAEAVAKLRTFAIPESGEGSELIEILDDIDRRLAPRHLDTDTIRSSVPYAEHVAATASTLAAAIEGWGFGD